MAQKFDARQTISRDALANLLGINGTELDDLLRSINKEFNAPLRMSATSPTPDAKINFQASQVEAADLTAKEINPIAATIPSFVASTIDFQTGATTGGTISITFPASTVGFYRRVAFSLGSNGTLQAVFSAEAATLGALANAGTLFVSDCLPIGWIDLECTAASPGRFKTAGSATNIIENKVSGVNRVHKIADSSVQLFNNITLNSPRILTPSQLDVKQDTEANLVTYALTATNGQLAFATDTKKMYQIVDGLLVDVGSGSGNGGSLDTLFTQTFENAVLGDFTQVGLILDTTAADLINGDITAKMVHDSVTTQSFKESVILPQKYQSFADATRNLTIALWARSNATAGNVTLEIRDETNNAVISSEVLTTISTENANENVFSFDVPLTCEEISYKVSGLPESGSPETFIDDISIYLTPSELTQSLLFQENDSVFSATSFTGLALASTNTGVFYFPTYTVRQNIGSAYSINQSATLGTSIVIQKEGIHRFTFGYNPNTTQRIAYITRNATVLTATTVTNATEIISSKFTDTPSNIDGWSISGEAYCYVGDVIRFQLSGSSNIENTGTTADGVICSYQGVLKQINTNPDSKITIPTTELRMEGASSRGATDTAIVRFDSIAKLKGDAFEIVSTAALGTAITMKKAGKLSVSATINTGSQSSLQITKNQATRTAASSTASEILASDWINAGSTSATGNPSWDGNVVAGDVIRVSLGSTNPIASANNSLNLIFQEQDISVSVTNTLPQFSEADSSIRVDTANGFGATNTKIRRFSTVRHNLGDDIVYTDSATEGAKFQVLSDGIYSITYMEQSANCVAGLTLNSANLTTNITSLVLNANNEVLSISALSTGDQQTTSWTGFLTAGDIVRPHTNGTAATDNDVIKFTMAKVGKPNVTGVDVTPFINIPTQSYGSISDFRVSSTVLEGTNEWRFATGVITNVDPTLMAIIDDSANTRTKFQALKRCTVSVSWSAPIATAGNVAYIYKNGSIATRGNHTYANNTSSACSYETILEAGEYISFGSSSGNAGGAEPYGLSIAIEATPDAIVTNVESFSSDTASFVYAGSAVYTMSTLQNAPVGTFITFTYASGGNVRTQTTTAPTQTTSDMNSNGIQIFTRPFNATSTAGNPTAVAIQIGKGLKGKSLDLYKSAAKTTSGSLDTHVDDNDGFRAGMPFRDYDEKTGILYLDAGYNFNTGITSANFIFSDISQQSNGYIVINASKNPSLTGVITPRARGALATGYTGTITSATIINCTTVVSNPQGDYNAGTFTCNEVGFVDVSGSIDYPGTGSGATQMNLHVYKNGSQVSTTQQYNPQSGAGMGANITTLMIPVVKGDLLTVRATAVGYSPAATNGHVSFAYRSGI
jgi:hypothetical protein